MAASMASNVLVRATKKCAKITVVRQVKWVSTLTPRQRDPFDKGAKTAPKIKGSPGLSLRRHGNGRMATDPCGWQAPPPGRCCWPRVQQHHQPRATYSSDTATSTAAQAIKPDVDDDNHTIIQHTEKSSGPGDKREFQAETRMLLDIVAKSLYSEKEVFIRELISNASDALEKFRFLSLTDSGVEGKDRALEIHIGTDKLNRTFTIQDTGVGMTKESLIDNLGVIARSGSKAFLKELQEKGSAASEATNIIGQFGVGFYSSFMVANKVEVFSKDGAPNSKGYHWVSDGSGTYEISEAEGVQPGTKIVLHLKPECSEFSDEDVIKGVIKKYSNFVGSPIFLNGKRSNVVKALWLMDPKEVSESDHDEFYRFVSGTYDRPRFTLHYRSDAPLNVRCLLYVPEGKPGLFEMSRETELGVSLYCRKVLIKNKADNLLPKWLRFVKGVVDSEDIPLNLSRELLQDSALIRKLRTVLTNRILRFLNDQARKEPEKYDLFFRDYGLFLKEGIVMGGEQLEKEEIGKLLRFESSAKVPGTKVGLAEYGGRMREGQKDIYYLAAPSRQLAETSPYFEALQRKEVEVLFCYEPYDELVLLHLREFDRKLLTSIEKEMRRDKEEDSDFKDEEGGLAKADVDNLLNWLKTTLGNKVSQVKVTRRLSTHPCAVTVEEMGAARHFLRTQFQAISEEQRYKVLEPILEVNASARAESPDKILPDVSDESSDCIEVLEVVLKTNSSESEDDDHPPMVWRFSNCKENRRTVSEVATEISGLTSPNSSSTSEKANSKVSSESKIPNSSNTVIQSESGHPLRGRKRKYENQSREQRKLKANCNKRYISARGVEVLPKEFDRAFSCGCKKKCTELISPHRRENEIFTKFWALGNYEARCAFINAHVKQTSKKRSYVKGSSKRNFSRKYYFDNIEVCKMAFLRTLNVNQSRINAALQKVNDAKFADRRGEARGGWNALPTEKMEKVIDHIKKFPRHQLTLRRMYQLYCAEEIHPVSESTYRHVFYNKFNLRFKTTNKDSSDICNKFCVQNQTGISDEPLNLKISHKEHRKKLKT